MVQNNNKKALENGGKRCQFSPNRLEFEPQACHLPSPVGPFPHPRPLSITRGLSHQCGSIGSSAPQLRYQKTNKPLHSHFFFFSLILEVAPIDRVQIITYFQYISKTIMALIPLLLKRYCKSFLSSVLRIFCNWVGSCMMSNPEIVYKR